MHSPVTANAFGSPALRAILEKHPFVRLDSFKEGPRNEVDFAREGRTRKLVQGNPDIDGAYGLAELMDNNPLVCVDQASCPGAAATLAAIAVAPLAKAGMLIERPAFVFSFETSGDEIDRILALEGWSHGAAVASRPAEIEGCVIATSLSSITMPAGPQDIIDLYDECFGRSFFVRRHEGDDWGPHIVRGTPNARFQLHLSEGVLRVDVIADPNGKCGASQVVHMLNVMACFEEDLGL
jgi:N-acetyl-gamma-glutamylphosphate reductase